MSPGASVWSKQKDFAGFQSRAVLHREVADPQLGPLQIDEDANRLVTLAFRLADDRHRRFGGIVWRMAHVDPERVCPGRNQPFDHGSA